MIGAQNQGPPQQIGAARVHAPTLRQRVLDRRGLGARRGGDFGEQPQDAPSRLRDAVGPDIERQRIPGGRTRQHALSPRHEGQTAIHPASRCRQP